MKYVRKASQSGAWYRRCDVRILPRGLVDVVAAGIAGECALDEARPRWLGKQRRKRWRALNAKVEFQNAETTVVLEPAN